MLLIEKQGPASIQNKLPATTSAIRSSVVLCKASSVEFVLADFSTNRKYVPLTRPRMMSCCSPATVRLHRTASSPIPVRRSPVAHSFGNEGLTSILRWRLAPDADAFDLPVVLLTKSQLPVPSVTWTVTLTSPPRSVAAVPCVSQGQDASACAGAQRVTTNTKNHARHIRRVSPVTLLRWKAWQVSAVHSSESFHPPE